MEYWKFVAGIGLFLFGMSGLEQAIEELAGRNFKLFLIRFTSNRLLAVFHGIWMTALLQSSSLVILMVIAFAGANILPLSRCLGIVLGANLGTTFTGWIVQFLGFSYGFETVALPILAIGSIGISYFRAKNKFHSIFLLLCSFGILMLGMDFIKSGASEGLKFIDLQQLIGGKAYLLLPIGFVVTAIIQSSTTMMVITLSALHAGLLDLTSSAWVIIGADLGTTVTGLIGSLGGNVLKRRVGLAHFSFNLSTAILAVLLAPFLISSIQSWWPSAPDTQILVAFHSTFNALGIVLFLPFLSQFEAVLSRLVKSEVSQLCPKLAATGTDVPEAALHAIAAEIFGLQKKVSDFVLAIISIGQKSAHDLAGSIEMYERIKDVETEILAYAAELQRSALDPVDSWNLQSRLAALRKAIEAAKAARDIEHNLVEFRESVVDTIHSIPKLLEAQYFEFGKSIVEAGEQTKGLISVAQQKRLSLQNDGIHFQVSQDLYDLAQKDPQVLQLVSEALNANREIYLSNRLLLESMALNG